MNFVKQTTDQSSLYRPSTAAGTNDLTTTIVFGTHPYFDKIGNNVHLTYQTAEVIYLTPAQSKPSVIVKFP